MTILITGASSGIGKELAYLYAKERKNLILVSRSEKELTVIKKDLENLYRIKVTVLALDLAKSGAAKLLYHDVSSNVNVLINNAGFGDFGEVVEQTPKHVAEMIGLNITTLTELCILFGRDFKKRKQGAILNVASIVGFMPIPYFAAYAASKAYVLSFSEALAKELEDYNVTVTCLCPGGTRTNFFVVAGKGKMKQERQLMSASDVALIGKKALEAKKMTVIAGWRNKISVFLVRLFPRFLVAAVIKHLFLLRRSKNKELVTTFK